jgi:hypothetical protein
MRVGVHRGDPAPLSPAQLRVARIALAVLVTVDVALAAAWLAGVSAAAWPVRIVTLWMTSLSVWVSFRENPEVYRRRTSSVPRLIVTTVLVLLAVVALTLLFR